MPTRRAFLGGALTLAAAGALRAAPLPVAAGAASFGPPTPDPRGILDLPAGFTYRVLARAGMALKDGRTRPPDNDLNVFFPREDGTSYLVTGHEITGEYGPGFTGSLSRLTLDSAFRIRDSRLLAEGMRFNCSGCLTPWGTVLTCEEFPRKPYESYPGEGYVWEVDIETGAKTRLDALGRFSHECALVHEGRVYLTEDDSPGFLYRFTPRTAGALTTGRLQAYRASTRSWVAIRDPYHAPAEAKAKGATAFNRPETLVLTHNRRIVIAETGGSAAAPYGRLFRLDPATGALSVLLTADGPTMANPDNLLFAPDRSIYVCEDKPSASHAHFGPEKVLRLLPGTNHAEPFAVSYRGEPSGPAMTPNGGAMFLNVMADRDSFTLLIEGFPG